MSNPLAKENPLAKAVTKTPTVIKAIKFKEFGRTGESEAVVRSLSSVQRGAVKAVQLDEDPAQRGVWVDECILVPWSNLLWVDYSA